MVGKIKYPCIKNKKGERLWHGGNRSNTSIRSYKTRKTRKQREVAHIGPGLLEIQIIF
jgi:hypothetical protein